MALSITQREVGGVTVLTLAGDLGLGQESASLRDKVKKLLAEGTRKIVLDMAKVSLIDSAGLGTLVGLHQSAKTAGGAIRMCNLNSRLKELLVMTRLIVIFGDGVSNGEADAIKSLAAN